MTQDEEISVKMRLGILSALALFCTLSSSLVLADEVKPVKPVHGDKCPVCGMFVIKYPDFLAEIVYNDGTYAVFDGMKDLMKYYVDLEKYNPSKKVSDIAMVYVTDYYGMEMIDATKAYLVVGSDVYGPMGRELIPFTKEEDAKEFMVDHVGKSMLRFSEVTKELLKSLD